MFVEVPDAPASPPNTGSLPAPPRTRARGRGTRFAIPTRTWLAPTLLGIGLIILWAGVTRFSGISPLFLPSPLAVLAALGAGLADGSLLSAAGITLLESLCGFALGAAIALPIGYAVARSPLFAALLQPYLAASQALPAVALAPLFIVWLGYGLSSIAALAALIVFFPAAITTTLGVRTLDRDVLDAARVDGAGGWHLLVAIELPLALPAIMAGLRTSLTLSITGAVVGEFVLGVGGFSFGLGSLSTQALNTFDTAQMFAVLIVLGALAALLYGVARVLERRLSYLEEP